MDRYKTKTRIYDLNVFFKTLDKSWDFVSQLWKSDREIEKDNANSFQEKIDGYLYANTRLGLQALLLKNFQEVFEIDEEKILSQRQLDDISYDLEIKALQFQKEFSSEEDKLKILGLNAAKLFNLEVPKDKQ